jgi:hypothetical protein
MGDELAGRPNDAPPGKTGASGKNVANRAGRTRVTGSACDFAIADHLPTPEIS